MTLTVGDLRRALADLKMPDSSPLIVYSAGTDHPIRRIDALPSGKKTILVLSTSKAMVR